MGDPVEYASPLDKLSWSQRFKALPLFFYHRARRGGLRLVIQVIAILCGIVLLHQLWSSRITDSLDYPSILSWTSSTADENGGLRIVAFGTQDLVGSSADINGLRTTWPEQLCKELECSSLLSFIPSDHVSPGLTSNEIYGSELRTLKRLTEKTNILEQPASDFGFLPEQYPIPSHTPDLEAQIRQFLSMPPPEAAPRETLWVFTFGTWDIWNMAAMPLKSGEDLVDNLTNHLFRNVEYLYRKSLVPGSIAYSDFWSNVTEADLANLTAPNAAETMDKRKLEGFRLLIPQLFDISLAPGWDSRLSPSIPYTRSDHLRNAAVLTERWNTGIRHALDIWIGWGSAKPEGMDEEESVEQADKPPKKGWLVEYMPTMFRPHEEQPNEEVADEVIYAPYPQRLGLHSRPDAGILDAMAEEDMQKSMATDNHEFSNVGMRFSDARRPCVGSEDGEASQGVKCDVPSDHLFYDDFTLGQRAINQLIKETSRKVLETLLVRDKEEL